MGMFRKKTRHSTPEQREAALKERIARWQAKCSGPNPPAKCKTKLQKLLDREAKIAARVAQVQDKVAWQDQLRKLPTDKAAALLAAKGVGVPANPLEGWDELPQWKWAIVGALGIWVALKLKFLKK